ncbi:nitroreductase [Dokdonella sp.]|uniref:nitroreductase family protein n=1 Tax=Dokdonella sp. TaxID=2291710 RepID=UPI0035290ACC
MSLEFLENRLSVPSRQLGAPGPDAQQLDALLSAAIRVPDHGRLAPWRLLLVRDEARRSFGEQLARIHEQVDPGAGEAALIKDRERYLNAPVIVVVIARVQSGHKVPEQEQVLSAGCVAYNLLLGAQALGFGAQWLTGWAAYEPEVCKLLGLDEGERVIGFVHIGTALEVACEHPRAELADVLGEWTP